MSTRLGLFSAQRLGNFIHYVFRYFLQIVFKEISYFVSCIFLFYFVHTCLTHIRSQSENKLDWCQKQFLSIPKNKIHGFSFKVIPSSLIHFPILLYHASKHSWKDSSGMILGSVEMTLLRASTHSKWVSICVCGK